MPDPAALPPSVDAPVAPPPPEPAPVAPVPPPQSVSATLPVAGRPDAVAPDAPGPVASPAFEDPLPDPADPWGQIRQRPRLLSVLMPIYNERRTLRTIIRRVLAVKLPAGLALELVAVDDCSKDGSRELLAKLAAEDPRIRPVFHEHNTGKGGAIHTAIGAMTGDLAVIQDADLEYDPAEIPKLLGPLLDGRADAVFGSRFAGSEVRRVLYYWHSVANKFLTWVTNVVSDLNLTDMETCYKAVRADLLRQTRLRFRRFGIEPELTVRLAQWGARIYEVPISYSGRTYAEGKKITWRDGVKALGAILWTAWLDKRFTTHDGYYILRAVRNAGGFNRWMFGRIAKWVGKRVVEAGCGIGNMTELMLDRERLTCLDIDPLYVEMIARRFGHLENFTVFRGDLAERSTYDTLAAERPDTVICLNVLEHIADEQGVLTGFHRALAPGGHAIILVPQHPWLYTGVDETLGHVKRYRRAELVAAMEKAGFDVVDVQGFNKMGAPGWWVSGKILRNRHIKPGQMKLFNMMLPIAKLAEWIPGLPSLSVIAVGRKR